METRWIYFYCNFDPYKLTGNISVLKPALAQNEINAVLITYKDMLLTIHP